jgi:hypothetical protein
VRACVRRPDIIKLTWGKKNPKGNERRFRINLSTALLRITRALRCIISHKKHGARENSNSKAAEFASRARDIELVRGSVGAPADGKSVRWGKDQPECCKFYVSEPPAGATNPTHTQMSGRIVMCDVRKIRAKQEATVQKKKKSESGEIEGEIERIKLLPGVDIFE